MLCVDRMWYLHENNNIVCSSGTSPISKGRASQSSHMEAAFPAKLISSQCSMSKRSVWSSWAGEEAGPICQGWNYCRLNDPWPGCHLPLHCTAAQPSRTEPGKNDSSRRLQGFQGYQHWVVISQINSSGLLLAPIDKAGSSLLLGHHSEFNPPTFTVFVSWFPPHAQKSKLPMFTGLLSPAVPGPGQPSQLARVESQMLAKGQWNYLFKTRK